MNAFRLLLILLAFITIQACSPFQPLEISKPQKLKVEKMSFTSLDLRVSLKIVNPNFYNITIEDFDLNAKVNGVDFGKVNHREDVVIKRNSEEMVSIPLMVSADDMLSKAISVLRSMNGSKVKIALKGYLDAKGLIFRKQVPVKRAKTVELIK